MQSFHITSDGKLLTDLKGECFGSKKLVRRLFQSSVVAELTEYGRRSQHHDPGSGL